MYANRMMKRCGRCLKEYSTGLRGPDGGLTAATLVSNRDTRWIRSLSHMAVHRSSLALRDYTATTTMTRRQGAEVTARRIRAAVFQDGRRLFSSPSFPLIFNIDFNIKVRRLNMVCTPWTASVIMRCARPVVRILPQPQLLWFVIAVIESKWCSA